jgi:hypothetical protein
MSDFTAIRGASLTLKALLEEHITRSTEPQIRGVAIDLRSPREMRDDDDEGISLWLYRVTRDPDLLNRPPPRVAPDQFAYPPVPVDLYFLVTPIQPEPEDEQALLGRVLQVFHDHPVLRGSDLQDSLSGQDEELRVHLEMLSLEELTRVWNALQQPYQLSVSYLVQVVTIASDREPVRRSPVAVRDVDVKQILRVQ